MHFDDPIPDLKRQVAAEIARLIATGNAWDIAIAIGTDQPRVSDLRRGKLDRFSLETLIRYAHRLRRRVVLSFEHRELRLNTKRCTHEPEKGS
jgi:predicted XRE-type DNA-binding protein